MGKKIDWKAGKRKNQVRELVPKGRYKYYYNRGWRAGTRFYRKGYEYRYFYHNSGNDPYIYGVKRRTPTSLEKALWNKKKADYRFKTEFRKYHKHYKKRR